MKLKYRYKKIRYICSWKFPRLYRALRKLTFPAQVAALCLLLTAIVSFYQNNWSFEATSRASAINTAAKSIHPVLKTKAVDSPAIVQASLSLEPTVPITQNNSAEEALTTQILKAEALLQQKKQQTRLLEEKVKRAKTLLKSAETTQPEANSTNAAGRIDTDFKADRKSRPQVLSETWLQAQPSDHYVVQISSSTDYELLAEFAGSRAVKAPLVIYPSTVSEQGNVIYSLSSGLFISKDDATTEMPALAAITEQDGVWVRKISDINTGLASLPLTR